MLKNEERLDMKKGDLWDYADDIEKISTILKNNFNDDVELGDDQIMYITELVDEGLNYVTIANRIHKGVSNGS